MFKVLGEHRGRPNENSSYWPLPKPPFKLRKHSAVPSIYIYIYIYIYIISNSVICSHPTDPVCYLVFTVDTVEEM